ncbi:MAG: MgtC/SapB family protein [Bacillota bacterium]
MSLPPLVVVSRLLVAFFLGGLVGLERESHRRPAGLRTHILVCVGSTIITLVSIDMLAIYGAADPGRIAAQVVSGIGFLGAGTILREGAIIRGLTTAASLWVIAAIGLAVGAGMFLPAALGAVLALVTLLPLSRAGKLLGSDPRGHHLLVECNDVPGQVGAIGTYLGAKGVNITALEIKPAGPGAILLDLVVSLARTRHSLLEVAGGLAALAGVRRVEEGTGAD